MHALRMLPRSLVALTSSLLVSVVYATSSAPTCISSPEGYPTGQVNYLYNNFCQVLANKNFLSDMAVYGMPVISFSFTAGGAGIGTCDQNNCLASYKTLVAGCGLANGTIWGTGSINAGCGVYNYTIWDTAKNPISLGEATTTLVGATMTTAATVATSTPSTQASSTSSAPTLIVDSVISSSTGSSSIEPADITSSSLLPTAMSYANSTSASLLPVTTISKSSAAVASGTISGKVSTTTKPDVGSTVLGSGADIVKVSGFSLMAVACVFAGFL